MRAGPTWSWPLALLRPVAAAAALAWTTSAALAQAPGASPSAADLYKSAMKLRDTGDCAGAIVLFEQSLELGPTMGTRFHLADCMERVGRVKSAWSLFRAVADEAAANPRIKNIEAEARQRADSLAPKVPRLTVVVSEEARSVPQIRVELDGEALSDADWNKPLPVDPGDHVVRAHAAGKRSFEARERLQTQGAAVEVTIPPLADELPPGPAPPSRPAPPPGDTVSPPLAKLPVSAPPASAAPPLEGPSSRRVAALALGGGGVVGVGLGTVLGILAIDRNAAWLRETAARCDAKGDCDTVASINRIQGIEADRATFGDASTAAFVVGAALLAGGAVLWLTAPAAPRRFSLRLSPAAAVVAGLF